MYVGAIKWAMGLVDVDLTPRPLPRDAADAQNHRLKSRPVSEELRPQ
jgi:hypothetical protein